MNILKKYKIFGLEEISVYLDAALVTCDPILLLGESGCGKTTTFNIIMILMDQIVQTIDTSKVNPEELYGFPVPIKKADGIGYRMEFCETPLTVYDKTAILFNELSRCRIDIQNQILDIIQERAIQGIPLDDLKYIWADMNPVEYAGSEPLPLATARRFSAIIKFPTYKDMTKENRIKINKIDLKSIQKDEEYIKYIEKISFIYQEEKKKEIYSFWRDQFLINLSKMNTGDLPKYSPNGRQAGFIDRFLAAIMSVHIARGEKKHLSEITQDVCLMIIPEIVSEQPISPSLIQEACDQANDYLFNDLLKDYMISENPMEAMKQIWGLKELSNYEKSIHIEIQWRALSDYQKNIFSVAFSGDLINDDRLNEDVVSDISRRLQNMSNSNSSSNYVVKDKNQIDQCSLIINKLKHDFGETGNYLISILSNNSSSVPPIQICEEFIDILTFFSG